MIFWKIKTIGEIDLEIGIDIMVMVDFLLFNFLLLMACFQFLVISNGFITREFLVFFLLLEGLIFKIASESRPPDCLRRSCLYVLSFSGWLFGCIYIYKIPLKRKGILHIVNECISQKILIVQWELQQEGVTWIHITPSFSLEKKKKKVAKKFACNKYNKFMFCPTVEILKNLMKQWSS